TVGLERRGVEEAPVQQQQAVVGHLIEELPAQDDLTVVVRPEARRAEQSGSEVHERGQTELRVATVAVATGRLAEALEVGVGVWEPEVSAVDAEQGEPLGPGPVTRRTPGLGDAEEQPLERLGTQPVPGLRQRRGR